jgi:hypothetical protein
MARDFMVLGQCYEWVDCLLIDVVGVYSVGLVNWSELLGVVMQIKKTVSVAQLLYTSKRLDLPCEAVFALYLLEGTGI